MWTITAFTAENGPLRVIPGSHRVSEPPIDMQAFGSGMGPHPKEVRVTTPAGSVILFNSADLWHSGTFNYGPEPRLAVTRPAASISRPRRRRGPRPTGPARRAPVRGDAQREVDGPVGDLALADLHVDRVDENHRVHRIQRTVLPFCHPLHHPVGNRGDGLLGDLRAVDLRQMRGDLAVRQPFRRQGKCRPPDRRRLGRSAARS